MNLPNIEQQGYAWVKATDSGGGNCVEVAPIAEHIGVRHSVRPDDGVLLYSKAEFAAFLKGAKKGEFDYLVSGEF